MFFVREDVIAKRPQAVKAFLQGWQDTIAFMKANKDKTVEITSKVVNISPAVAARAYDEQISVFSPDLTFDPKAVDGAQAVVHRDGPAEGNPRRQGDVHDAVPAGEGRHVASSANYRPGLPTISGALPIQGPPSSKSSIVSTRKLPSIGASLPGEREEAITASG